MILKIALTVAVLCLISASAQAQNYYIHFHLPRGHETKTEIACITSRAPCFETHSFQLSRNTIVDTGIAMKEDNIHVSFLSDGQPLSVTGQGCTIFHGNVRSLLENPTIIRIFKPSFDVNDCETDNDQAVIRPPNILIGEIKISLETISP